jgi:esterase
MKLFTRKVEAFNTPLRGEGGHLIILHGLFGMSDNWMTLAKEFAANGFSVYLPDARNHGRSPHSDEFNYPAMAADILELMNAENISTASLLGHSMGGKTAMFFATQYPERVRKLIVADMSPKQYQSTNENVIVALKSIDLNAMTSRKEVEQKLRATLQHDEVTTQFLLKSLYWKEGDRKKLDWRFNLPAIANNIANTGEALPQDAIYNGDTLFIRGEKSNYITSADEPLIKKHFPQATIKTIPGAGHWVHAENPKAFMEAVLEVY